MAFESPIPTYKRLRMPGHAPMEKGFFLFEHPVLAALTLSDPNHILTARHS